MPNNVLVRVASFLMGLQYVLLDHMSPVTQAKAPILFGFASSLPMVFFARALPSASSD